MPVDELVKLCSPPDSPHLPPSLYDMLQPTATLMRLLSRAHFVLICLTTLPLSESGTHKG